MLLNQKSFYSVIILVFSISFTSCSPLNSKGSLGENLVPLETSKVQATNSFEKTWFNNSIDLNYYEAIFFKSVNVDYLYKQHKGTKGLREKDIQNLKRLCQEHFKEEFRKDINQKYHLTDSKGPKTLVVEMALTHWDPKQGYSFEARIKDSEKEELVAKFADKKSKEEAGKFVLEKWAKQFLKVLHQTPTEMNAATSPFDLLEW